MYILFNFVILLAILHSTVLINAILLMVLTLENASTPRGGTNKYPPYPLVPPIRISVLTLVPPNPRVLKTGTKNRY